MYVCVLLDMDAYFAVVKPKLDNLLRFMVQRLQEDAIAQGLGDEFLGSIMERYHQMFSDPIVLGMALKELLKFWRGPELGIDKEGLKKEVEEHKKTAYALCSVAPGFNQEHWDKCMNYKMPDDVDEKLYAYYHMLCDLAVAYEIDKL